MKRTPLRKVSKKYSVELRAYHKERKVFLEGEGWGRCCEWPEGCLETADDVHHSMARGHFLRQQKYWIALCRPHHQWVEDHKNDARKMGLILYK